MLSGIVKQVTLSKALKALYSGAMAFLGGLATVLTGDATLGQVTEGQWVTICAFTLGAIGGTYGLAGWSGPRVNGSPPADK